MSLEFGLSDCFGCVVLLVVEFDVKLDIKFVVVLLSFGGVEFWLQLLMVCLFGVFGRGYFMQFMNLFELFFLWMLGWREL